VVHLLQDFLVDGLSQVNELVGVNCHVIYLYKHLGNTERELVITNDLVGVNCHVIYLYKHLGNTERELVITNDLVGVYCNVKHLGNTEILAGEMSTHP
jgi:hypothetical protein